LYAAKERFFDFGDEFGTLKWLTLFAGFLLVLHKWIERNGIQEILQEIHGG